MALLAEARGAVRVVALDAAAHGRGVVAGMPLPQAQALAADLLALPWNAEQLARAALEVTTALLQASPRVAWAGQTGDRGTGGQRDSGTAGPGDRGDGLWWVDAAGLGDERRLAQKLARIARGLAYGPARVGIADSAIAAHAATYGGRGRTDARARGARRPVATIVPSGRDAEFLAPFPLALLELDEDLDGTLHALGLTTLGQVAALEEGEVEARFGPAGLLAHRLARGVDPRGPSTPRDDALPLIECDLGGPVATSEPLLFVLRGALGSLGAALRGRGLAAREVTIALRLDDGSTAERAVRPARPSSHQDVLFDFCRAALEDWRLPEPVVGLALAAPLTVPAAGEQGDLLAPRWADPAALEAAFDRIRGREGPDAVAVPEAHDGHLPEDEGAWADGTVAKLQSRGKGVAVCSSNFATSQLHNSALRRLSVPEPIRVRLGRTGVEAFHHGDVWHDVTAWSGPERLAPRWWRNAGADRARDYYTARTAGGTLWLLYRSVKGRTWFVEGWWD